MYDIQAIYIIIFYVPYFVNGQLVQTLKGINMDQVCSSIQTCTLGGHLHRVTHKYTRCHINTINSPDDEHRGARNM